MLNPANIFRSKRKTLALFVDPKGELIVKAPLKMPDYKIFDFVKSKEDWISMRQHQISQNSYINRNVVCYNSFLYLGEELIPIVSNSTKVIAKSDGALLIPAKLDQTKILGRVEKWFRAVAVSIIHERAEYFSNRLRLGFSEIIINNNKTRWGCCDKNASIAINWRAVMLPPNLLDYIIIHEFCHLLEFNHTQNFWKIVETILPDWRVVRKHLKQMNWILQLFRKE